MNVPTRISRFPVALAALCLPLLLPSCASIGPKTIERDRMDYGMSVRSSVKEQLLANIVGLRYLEAPVFVDVSSVINQYALSGRVDAGIGFNDSLTGSDSGNIGAGAQWEDRPTITYTPISGRKFSESLLTPIPPEALFALVQSGWPGDLMFRLTVTSINGVEDADGSRQADPRFRELLKLWTRLRDARAIGLRRSAEGTDQKPQIVVYLNDDDADEQVREDLNILRDILKLNPDQDEYALVYGLVPTGSTEIAVLTQSILDIMVKLGREIDVPPEHIESGRTGASFVDTGAGGPLFRVRFSEERPEDAYVAVQDRGYWFYIDDRDMISKRTFGVLQILLSLTDSDEGARGPVVSIGGG